MEITFTRPALRDLERIHAFIARDDPSCAYQVLADIRVAINRLAVYPAMGRPGKKAGTRELIVPHLPDKVLYRVRGEKVLFKQAVAYGELLEKHLEHWVEIFRQRQRHGSAQLCPFLMGKIDIPGEAHAIR